MEQEEIELNEKDFNRILVSVLICLLYLFSYNCNTNTLDYYYSSYYMFYDERYNFKPKKLRMFKFIQEKDDKEKHNKHNKHNYNKNNMYMKNMKYRKF